MLPAKSGRSGKQEQVQNSPNLEHRLQPISVFLYLTHEREKVPQRRDGVSRPLLRHPLSVHESLLLHVALLLLDATAARDIIPNSI